MLLTATIIALFICGFFVYFVDSTLGGLDFTTSKKAAKQVALIIRQRNLETGQLYDLGSSRGGFALKISKNLPKLLVLGIDNNNFRILSSKIRSLFFKNVSFRQEDIFSTNISLADIIYLYVPQYMMPKLQTKLQKELKPGSLVITNSVSFPSWQPSETFSLPKDKSIIKKLFVYAKV